MCLDSLDGGGGGGVRGGGGAAHKRSFCLAGLHCGGAGSVRSCVGGCLGFGAGGGGGRVAFTLVVVLQDNFVFPCLRTRTLL